MANKLSEIHETSQIKPSSFIKIRSLLTRHVSLWPLELSGFGQAVDGAIFGHTVLIAARRAALAQAVLEILQHIHKLV
jgi:hypothetical protein